MSIFISTIKPVPVWKTCWTSPVHS